MYNICIHYKANKSNDKAYIYEENCVSKFSTQISGRSVLIDKI